MSEDWETSGYDLKKVAVSTDAGVASSGLVEEVETLRAERDALRQRLDSMTADLDNFARVRDEFIAIASHDLKAPLTSILIAAQLTERLLAAPIPDADKATTWVRIIHDRVNTMTLLINDLLDASRIQTGAFDLRLAPCEMNACVATVIKRLGPDVQARVTVMYAPHPVRGHWDPQRIEQVLSNLLDNALKYSPNGENISLVVEEHTEEVEVTVSDRGVGIAPTALPRLFGRFYRTEDATAGTIPGTGLGLYICERIITAHGGRLWAESSGVGEGSSFRFVVPTQAAVPFATRPEGQVR